VVGRPEWASDNDDSDSSLDTPESRRIRQFDADQQEQEDRAKKKKEWLRRLELQAAKFVLQGKKVPENIANALERERIADQAVVAEKQGAVQRPYGARAADFVDKECDDASEASEANQLRSEGGEIEVHQARIDSPYAGELIVPSPGDDSPSNRRSLASAPVSSKRSLPGSDWGPRDTKSSKSSRPPTVHVDLSE